LVTLFPEVEFDYLRFRKVPNNFWAEASHRRAFMESLARMKHFDPRKAENWYSFKKEDFLQLGGTQLIKYHQNSHIQAIKDLFPEVKFDPAKFSKGKNYWGDADTRRQFFESLAGKMNFDPLVAKNWYDVSWQKIVDMGGSSALRYHNQSHIKAITDLFPDVQFDTEMFYKRGKDKHEPAASQEPEQEADEEKKKLLKKKRKKEKRKKEKGKKKIFI